LIPIGITLTKDSLSFINIIKNINNNKIIALDNYNNYSNNYHNKRNNNNKRNTICDVDKELENSVFSNGYLSIYCCYYIKVTITEFQSLQDTRHY
jgi:hypothetical protein